jgi:hypothetical protein
MPADLATYRALIPAHASVSDDTVNVWLGLATRRHTASAWGAVYGEAMCFWAAHFVEKIAGSSGGGGSGGAVGPLVSQKDGDLSRTYAAPAAISGLSPTDDGLATTEYGRAYLDLRNSRSATAPFVVTPC